MSDSIEDAYDGEIADFLFRARNWINRADQSAAYAISEGDSLDDSESMANIGSAHAFLAAVMLILVKELP